MAQMRFARIHGARPGFARVSDGRVFFYRDDRGGTERWLIDGEGEALDSTYLPRDPATARPRHQPSCEASG
jgi:hypothetical protein